MKSPQKSKGRYFCFFQTSVKNYKMQFIELFKNNLLKCNMVFRIEL